MIELATTPDRDAVLSVPVNEHARWIALSRVKGLGCVSFRKLAAHFADPTRALSAPASELARVPDLDSDVIHSLRNFAEWKDVDEELRRIERSGAKLITFGDFDYPARLRNIADPPPVLYVKGEIQSIDDKAVAIVGSRSASDYGRRVARDLCRGLVSLGFTVVSGMALGIDGVAHETALNSGGRTIAVLGCGVDRVYPPNHAALYRRISEGGAVISELPIGTKPMAFNFPARNRLISGLSLGVVVVEATEKSGSLITARLALEQGREVFAVPGEVGAARSRGSHRLIRQGAKLVETVEDVIEEIAPQLLPRVGGVGPGAPALPKNVSDEVRKVFALLQEKSLQIDEVIESSGFPSAKVSQILLELELSGFLRQLPGKRYIAER